MPHVRIVCFGQQNWDYCWTAKQQFMTRLVRRGHQVLYIDPAPDEQPPGGDRYRALVPVRTRTGLREVRPGLFVYTYAHAPILRYRVNTWRRPFVLRRLVARLGFDDCPVILLHPRSAPLMRAIPRRGLIYFGVDDVSAFPNMAPERRDEIRALERDVLREADAAIAVSPRLYERFRELCPRSDLLPNAADIEHFGPAHLARVPPHAAIAPLPHPRIGFIGQVDERLDQELVLSLARHRRDWHIVLAGRVKAGVNMSRLTAEPNVHLLGYQPYERLPGVLREFDVCLVPYRRNDLTNACNPLKVFEYLAAGRPVVSTALDGLGPSAEAISVADTPDAFIAAVEEAAADPGRGREARMAFAAQHGWDARVDVLEARLAEIERTRPPAVVRGHRPPEPQYTAVVPGRKGRLVLGAGRLLGAVRRGTRAVAARLSPARQARVRRILVTRRSRLGDLIVFLPALHALRRRFPSARIVLGVQSDLTNVPFRSLLPVDEIRPLEVDAPMRQRLQSAWRLLRERFDVVVSGTGFFLLRDAFWAGAPERIGLDDGHPWQRFNTRRIPLEPSAHESENNLRLLETIGVTAAGDERVPLLPPPPAAVMEAAHAVLRDCGIDPSAPFVVVHPGAQKPSRRWPAERFGGLLERLLAERADLHVLTTGVPSERELIDNIRSALPPSLQTRLHVIAGRTGVEVLAALMRRSRATICNDTGTMHLARAAGAPLLALLGPENHRRWGPHPLGPAPALAIRHEVPCSPCARWECAGLYCLRLLTVDEAYAGLTALLDPTTPAAHTGLQPLQVRLARHSWESVRDALPLPAVSILLLGRRRSRDSGRAADDAVAVAASLQMIARQSYPRLEVVLARSLADSLSRVVQEEAAGSDLRLVVAESDSLHALLRSASGEFVAPLAPGYRWAASKLGEDVALLVRRPEAAAAFCTFGDGERQKDEGPSIGSALFRREALAAVLERVPSDTSGTRDIFGAVGPAARLHGSLAWTPFAQREALA